MHCYVNKLRQNVGLETWTWRQIVTSQTVYTKYKWPPHDPEPKPPVWKFSAYATDWKHKPTNQWQNWRGGRGAAAPPGRSFRSFWAPCHHIVNLIKWSLIDIAARQCVVLMIFGTLNYKNTLFLEKYRKTSHHFFNLEHRNQTLLKNSA